MSRNSRLATLFVTTGSVMMASLLAIFLMGRLAIDTNSALLRYHVLIGELQQTLSTMKDAETGQRGFLLTGKEKYLEPHDQAVIRIERELKSLEASANAGELSASDVAILRQLVNQKLDELRATIVLRRTKGLPAALTVVETDLGQNKMDSIRSQVSKMTMVEESRLSQANLKAAALTEYRNVVIALSTLLNLMVFLWAYRRIRDESFAREKAAFEILHQKELLDVTLASI